MQAGLLPIKKLSTAKNRLARDLSSDSRTEIARALMLDAFDLCTATDFVSWWVVTDDPLVASSAIDRGLACLPDEGGGLNTALSAAIQTVLKVGASSVTVMPCDVPLAQPNDVRDLLDTGETSDVVVVPSGDGGTNALHLSPPDALPPLFGSASFRAHVAASERLRLRCAILDLPRLRLDIDTADDVDAYLARPSDGRPSATREVLERLRAARLLPDR